MVQITQYSLATYPNFSSQENMANQKGNNYTVSPHLNFLSAKAETKDILINAQTNLELHLFFLMKYSMCASQP